jgi:hypothetical protein
MIRFEMILSLRQATALFLVLCIGATWSNPLSKFQLSWGSKNVDSSQDFFSSLNSKRKSLENTLKTKFSSLAVDFSTQAASVGKTKDDIAFVKSIEKSNKEALKDLNNLLSSTNGWSHVNTKNGVRVDKRFLKAGSYVKKADAVRGSKHACVKSEGIIDAPPEDVFQLFLDNSRVREYNEHCVMLKDVMSITKQPKQPKSVDFGKTIKQRLQTWTKITWASGPKYGPFKARDFISVIHYIKKEDGTRIILNYPAYISAYAPSGKYVRATILLAGNVIKPYGDSGQQTLLTQIAHINPGGGADTATAAWIINKLCAVAPPAFMRKLESAARLNFGQFHVHPQLAASI